MRRRVKEYDARAPGERYARRGARGTGQRRGRPGLLQLWRQALPHLAHVPRTGDPHREHPAREFLIDVRNVVRARNGREAIPEQTEIEVERAVNRAVAERAVSAIVLEDRRPRL